MSRKIYLKNILSVLWKIMVLILPILVNNIKLERQIIIEWGFIEMLAYKILSIIKIISPYFLGFWIGYLFYEYIVCRKYLNLVNLRKLLKFYDIAKQLDPLLNTNANSSSDSLYTIICDMGYPIKHNYESFLQRIILLNNSYICFMEKFYEFDNIYLLKLDFEILMTGLQQVIIDFNNLKGKWKKDYKRKYLVSLIEKYDSFINQINSFYEQKFKEKNRFKYLKSMLEI